MIFYLLRWWYGEGWLGQASSSMRRINKMFDYFSVDILLRTLFAPWKQTTTETVGDEGLDAQFRAVLDNIVSRAVGFFVRIFMLFFGVLFMGFMVAMLAVFMVIWPVIPILPIGLLVWGLRG